MIQKLCFSLRVLCASVVGFSCFFPAFSQTPLSGDIHDYPFTAGENPYVINENITIPSGTHCTIPAGCVFVFQPFTGLTVEGTLEVKGTAEQPVIFSSANDSLHNPGTPQAANAFDWNGIVIAAESYGTLFEHARVCCSVYGIKSQTPNITLYRCLFAQNGQYHFTIKEQIRNVLENFPFRIRLKLKKKPVRRRLSPALAIFPGRRRRERIPIRCCGSGRWRSVLRVLRAVRYSIKWLTMPTVTLNG